MAYLLHFAESVVIHATAEAYKSESCDNVFAHQRASDLNGLSWCWEFGHFKTKYSPKSASVWQRSSRRRRRGIFLYPQLHTNYKFVVIKVCFALPVIIVGFLYLSHFAVQRLLSAQRQSSVTDALSTLKASA